MITCKCEGCTSITCTCQCESKQACKCQDCGCHQPKKAYERIRCEGCEG